MNNEDGCDFVNKSAIKIKYNFLEISVNLNFFQPDSKCNIFM